jgi:large subunit ribosomal protein L10e
MALRKARAYTGRYARPYTRKSKKASKSYIRTIPNTKLTKLRMGDLPGYKEGKFTILLDILSNEQIQLRDNSIESVRQYLNRFIPIKVGKEFYIEVCVYPHHILREHALGGVAGADRLSTGMAHSFGKTIGRAALVKKGQKLFIIGVKDAKQESEARKLINSAKSRLPCSIRIEKREIKKI